VITLVKTPPRYRKLIASATPEANESIVTSVARGGRRSNRSEPESAAPDKLRSYE